MSNNKQEILKILKEAEENHNDIVSAISDKKEVFDLYLGSQVLFSPIIENPQVLLIGINPGPGYYNQTKGERVAQFQPLHKLEYLSGCNYTLAADTRSAFDEAGLTDLLATSTVKSNIYYMATNNTSRLWKLVCALCREQVKDPETIALDWTRRLVAAFNPKLIICEGAIAYQEFAKAMTGKKKYIKGEKVVREQVGNYPVIAYSRRRDSGIADRGMFVEMLKESIGELCPA